jgi:LPS-assembly lipoprotein
MSSSSRRALLLGALAATAGCTLRPLYGPQGATGTAAREALALGPLSGRNGYVFREAIGRRFLLDPGAPLVLTVDLAVRQTGLAISREGDIGRFNIEGTARFALRDRQGEAPLLEGSVRSISGYSTLASAYATRVAREAAEERVLTDLAERVFAQIAVRRSAAS